MRLNIAPQVIHVPLLVVDGVELHVEACVRPDVDPITKITVCDEAREDSLAPSHGEVHSRGHLKNTESEEHSGYP